MHNGESLPPPEFLTIQEAADLLRVNPRSIRRWIDAGEIAVVRPGGKTIRIPRSELVPATEEAS